MNNNLYINKNLFEYFFIIFKSVKTIYFLLISFFLGILIYFINSNSNFLLSKYNEPPICSHNCTSIVIEANYQIFNEKILLDSELFMPNSIIPILNQYRDDFYNINFSTNILLSFFNNVIADKNHHNQTYIPNSVYIKHKINKIQIENNNINIFFNNNLDLFSFDFESFKKDFNNLYVNWINDTYLTVLNDEVSLFLFLANKLLLDDLMKNYDEEKNLNQNISNTINNVFDHRSKSQYLMIFYLDLSKYFFSIFEKFSLDDIKNNNWMFENKQIKNKDLQTLIFFNLNYDPDFNTLKINEDTIVFKKQLERFLPINDKFIKDFISSCLISIAFTIFLFIFFYSIKIYKK